MPPRGQKKNPKGQAKAGAKNAKKAMKEAATKKKNQKQLDQKTIINNAAETPAKAHQKKADMTSPELLRQSKAEVSNRWRLLTPLTKSSVSTNLFERKKKNRPQVLKLAYGDWNRIYMEEIVKKHGCRATAQEAAEFKMSPGAMRLVKSLTRDQLHLHLARCHGLTLVEWLAVCCRGVTLSGSAFADLWLYIGRKAVDNELKFNLFHSDPRLKSLLQDMADQAMAVRALDARAAGTLGDTFVKEHGPLLDFVETGWTVANAHLETRPDLFEVDAIKNLNIVTRVVSGKILWEPQLKLVRTHKTPRQILEFSRNVFRGKPTVADLPKEYTKLEEYASSQLAAWSIPMNSNIRFVLPYRGYMITLETKPANLLLLIVRAKAKEYLAPVIPMPGDDAMKGCLGTYEKFNVLDSEPATDPDALVQGLAGELSSQAQKWKSTSDTLRSSTVTTLSSCLTAVALTGGDSETAILDKCLYETLDSSKGHIFGEQIENMMKAATSVGDLEKRIDAMRVSSVGVFFEFNVWLDDLKRALGSLSRGEIFKVPATMKDNSAEIMRIYMKTTEGLEADLANLEGDINEPEAEWVKNLMAWTFCMDSAWGDRLLPHKKKLAVGTIDDMMALENGDNQAASSSSSTALPIQDVSNDDDLDDILNMVGAALV